MGREAPLPPSLDLFTTTCRPNLDEGRGGEELHFATELSKNSQYPLLRSENDLSIHVMFPRFMLSFLAFSLQGCCRQENAIFPPHIHGTWASHFSV